jgi:hypothetical protein
MISAGMTDVICDLTKRRLAREFRATIRSRTMSLLAKMEFTDSSIVIDLSEVEKNKVDCHKNEMMISFKKGVVPVSCAGAKSRFTKNTRISKRIKSHIKTKQLKFWFKTE